MNAETLLGLRCNFYQAAKGIRKPVKRFAICRVSFSTNVNDHLIRPRVDRSKDKVSIEIRGQAIIKFMLGRDQALPRVRDEI